MRRQLKQFSSLLQSQAMEWKPLGRVERPPLEKLNCKTRNGRQPRISAASCSKDGFSGILADGQWTTKSEGIQQETGAQAEVDC